MIVGIGTDLIDIRRIEEILKKFPARFINRIFNPEEVKSIECSKNLSRTCAKRFAVKEAVLKALGTGLNNGISWHDIHLKHLPSGQPYITLSGRALDYLLLKIKHGNTPDIHVSITDEWPYAQAFVIISIKDGK